MGATYSGEYRILYSVGWGDFVLIEEKDTMGHFDIFFIFLIPGALTEVQRLK